MTQHRILTLAAIAALAVAASGAAFAAKPAASKHAASKQAAAPAQPTGQLVEYTELEHKVGSEIIVETTLHTVRRGTLVKYTNPGLTLQLGPENGSVELSIPRETVRNVSVVLAPGPDAAAQPTGTGSADKN